MDNNRLNGAARIGFKNNFETEILYKNGARESVLHMEAPQPDQLRMLHFKVSASEGVAVNLDDVRRFKTTVRSIAVPTSQSEIIVHD